MTWTLGAKRRRFRGKRRYHHYRYHHDHDRPAVPAFPITDISTATGPLDRDISKINPKVGLQWDVTRRLRLRAAYTETVKQVLVANRTLEPTQVAGFNQFFDEADGSKSRRYGVGLDWQLLEGAGARGGSDVARHHEPFADTAATPPVFVEDEADERLHRAYLYWTPLASLAVRTGFAYDAYEKESDDFSLASFSETPLELETYSVPVSATYFHPSGFFAGAGVTYVNQDVEKIPAFANQGDDHFAVVDAASASACRSVGVS